MEQRPGWRAGSRGRLWVCPLLTQLHLLLDPRQGGYCVQHPSADEVGWGWSQGHQCLEGDGKEQQAGGNMTLQKWEAGGSTTFPLL